MRITTEGHGSRRFVASYGTYTEAQEAVDRLADEGFPVQRLSIVAEGLRFEERVTGRKGYGRGARVVSFACSIVSIPAGTHRIQPVRFTILTTVGSAVWNAVLIGAGYA